MMIRSQIPTSLNSDHCIAAIICGRKKGGCSLELFALFVIVVSPPFTSHPFHWMNVFRISESLIGTTGEVICNRLDVRRSERR